MRSAIIAANWKMNMSNAAAVDLVSKMRLDLEAVNGIDVVLCPPYTALSAVHDVLGDSPIALGAQNVHAEAAGAFTGEISIDMLQGHCAYVIVGHSERRSLFGESDDLVGRKVKAVTDGGLKPILCVGERLEQREDGIAEAVVEQQVNLGLARLSWAGGVVIAYEPVWAIGTGRAATPEDAQNMMAHIRAVVARRFDESTAVEMPILYGGSVNSDNVIGFVRSPDVDGALVGGASLDAGTFVRLVTNAAATLA